MLVEMAAGDYALANQGKSVTVPGPRIFQNMLVAQPLGLLTFPKPSVSDTVR